MKLDEMTKDQITNEAEITKLVLAKLDEIIRELKKSNAEALDFQLRNMFNSQKFLRKTEWIIDRQLAK